jgi:hypothetical protein
VLAINVGVQQTQDVLELLASHERAHLGCGAQWREENERAWAGGRKNMVCLLRRIVPS